MQTSVIHVVTGPIGGAGSLVRELVHRLPEHGVEAQALYYRNLRDIDLSRREFSLGVHNPRSLRACFTLRDALQARGAYDGNVIVHAHLTCPLYHVGMLRRQIRGPVIFTEHSTYNHRRNKKLLLPLERMVYARYDRLVSISGGTQDALLTWLGRDHFKNKTEIIKNGCRMLTPIRRERRCRHAVRLVSVGFLNHKKGFDVALEAIHNLRASIEKYTIVGEGPERKGLKKRAKELGLEKKVIFTGHSGNVEKYFHDADLAVIPSRWEGFGLVAVEALSTGIPLVTSNVPGLREVVGDCDAAVLTPPDDVRALEERLRYAIDHLVGRDDVADAARARAEAFTVDKMVAEYADLYKRVSQTF